MAHPINALDSYYLTLSFLISLGIQLSAFTIAYSLQFDKITDLSGASNFFLNCLITLILSQTHRPRQIVVSTLIMLWSFRLGAFLFYRALKRGGDSRFDGMRASILRFGGFWTFQLIWIFTLTLPSVILNSPKVSSPSIDTHPAFGSATDIVGLVLWVLGAGTEAVGDWQKFLFKSRNPSSSVINDKGLWGWTRHPNYFGEITLWWGVWLMCLQPAIVSSQTNISSSARAALFASIVSPLFITLLLLFVSGMPNAEKDVQKKWAGKGDGEWEQFKAYLSRTSPLIPLPPALYSRAPIFLKRTILFDWPIFNVSESEVDGIRRESAVNQQNQDERGNEGEDEYRGGV